MNKKPFTIPKLKCLRCGYKWIPKREEYPGTCPNPTCRSPYWSTPRKRKNHNGK